MKKLLKKYPRHKMGTKWAQKKFRAFLCAQNHKSGQIIYFAKTTQTLDITAIKNPNQMIGVFGIW